MYVGVGFSVLIYIYRCCQFSLAEAGYYCARAFISGEFAASFGWQIYYYAVKTFQINHVKSVQWVLLVIVYAVIFGILYLLEKYLQKGGKEMHINRRELFTVLIITAAVFAVSNLSYIDKDSPFSSQFAAEMLLSDPGRYEWNGGSLCVPHSGAGAADEI